MPVREPMFIASGERLLGALAALRRGEASDELADLAAFARDGEPERAAAIRLPAPLVHPRLRAAVAHALGLTEAAVRRISRHDTCLVDGRESTPEELRELDWDVIHERGGGRALAAALAARPDALPDELRRPGRTARDLLVDVVAIVPPSQRPLIAPAGGQRVRGPDSRAYLDFLGRLQVFRRYTELSAPVSLLMASWERVQDAFDGLCAVLAGQPDPQSAWYDLSDEWLGARADAWSHATSRPEARPEIRAGLARQLSPSPPAPQWYRWSARDPLLPLGLAFTGPDTLLVRFAYAVAHLDLSSGTALFTDLAADAHVMGVTADLRHAVFASGGDHLPDVQVLDLQAHRWRSDWQGVGDVLLPIQLYKSGTWTIYDLPRRRARTFAERSDRTDQAVTLGPGMRMAWLADDPALGIFNLDSLHTHYDPHGLTGVPPPQSPGWSQGEDRVDEEDEPVAPSDVFDPDGEEPDDPRRAFTLTPAGEFRVVYRGGLFAGRTQRLRIPGPYSAVALDAAGRRLAIASLGRLKLLGLADDGSPICERALGLDHLHDLTLRGLPGWTAALERAVLGALGTRTRVAAASDELLADVLMSADDVEAATALARAAR